MCLIPRPPRRLISGWGQQHNKLLHDYTTPTVTPVSQNLQLCRKHLKTTQQQPHMYYRYHQIIVKIVLSSLKHW